MTASATASLRSSQVPPFPLRPLVITSALRSDQTALVSWSSHALDLNNRRSHDAWQIRHRSDTVRVIPPRLERVCSADDAYLAIFVKRE
jgi:hypothetical protein